MKVSTRAEYGLRALIDLAMHYGEGPIQSHEIARRQGLPIPYLNQLMVALKRAGLVTSKRGPNGGHILARPPGEITLREAFEVLEGPLTFWECVLAEGLPCVFSPGCGVRPVWEAIRTATEGVLNRMTLADLLSGDLREPVQRA